MVCAGAPVNIGYSLSGTATGATETGLAAAGLALNVSGTGVTITGTPTVAGSYPYTITTTGTCAPVTVSGTITVQSQTITLISAPGTTNQSVCLNAPIANIQYDLGGTATGVGVSGLPGGVNYTINSGIIIISGAPSVNGTFMYTLTTSGSCTPATITGTISTIALAIGGTVPSVSVCMGDSGPLTLTGDVGTIDHWEKSTDGGVTWVTIVNTSHTQNYANVMVPEMYRAALTNGCSTVYSSIATVGIHNYWTGAVSTDWNTAANWSDNQLPSTSCADVYVPNTVNKPVLSGSPVSTITNLHILAGSSVTINGTGMLQLGGAISNCGTFDVTAGAIEFNGICQCILRRV